MRLGQLIALNGVSFTIAGVLPRGFNGHDAGRAAAATSWCRCRPTWPVTRSEDDMADPNFWWVLMMGRLKPGATAERVQMAADLVVKGTVRAVEAQDRQADLPSVSVEDGSHGQTENRDDMVEPLRMMAAAVTVMLLVACANVANLLLATGPGPGARDGGPHRDRRAALAAGAAAADGRAAARRRCEHPRAGAGTMDRGRARPGADRSGRCHGGATRSTPKILAFTCGLAVGCSLLFALLPALRATDAALGSALQEGSRGTIGGRRRFAAGGALVSRRWRCRCCCSRPRGCWPGPPTGSRTSIPASIRTNVITFSIDTSLNGYDAARTRAYIARALDDLRATPGVNGASVSSHRLIANSSSIGITRAEGVAPVDPESPAAQEFIRDPPHLAPDRRRQVLRDDGHPAAAGPTVVALDRARRTGGRGREHQAGAPTVRHRRRRRTAVPRRHGSEGDRLRDRRGCGGCALHVAQEPRRRRPPTSLTSSRR